MGFFRFLKSLRTLARNGDITIDEAYKFAKQEFGEVSDLFVSVCVAVSVTTASLDKEEPSPK